MQARMSRRTWLLAIGGIVCVLGLLVALGLAFDVLGTGGNTESGAQDFKHDFRGQAPPPEMVPYGTLGDKLIKVEAEGLRLTLPMGRTDRSPLGLAMPLAVTGDFEITTTWELLRADEPAPEARSYGIGVLMSIDEKARIGRLVREHGNQMITWDRWAGEDGDRKFLFGAAPCRAKVLRMRLKRTGTTLHFLWAPETAGNAFQEIHQCAFTGDDITYLRLEVNSLIDGQPGTLDARLLGLEVRWGKPERERVAAPEEGQKTTSHAWLAVQAAG